MTALASYTDLVSEVQDWLFGRSDLAAKVPTFVRLCEAKANRTLMCRQMEARSSTVINLASAEPQYISLPADFHTMRSVRLVDAVNGPKRLRFATGAQIADLTERDLNTPGEPIWFSIFGSEMQLAPRPVTANTIEMVYRTVIPPLTTDNPSNWLLQTAPDLYLYGALLEAAPYLHEDERIQTWAAGAQGAIDGLNKLSEEALFNAGPLTMRRRGRSY